MVGLLRTNALKEQQPPKQIGFEQQEMLIVEFCGCPQDGPLPVLNAVQKILCM